MSVRQTASLREMRWGLWTVRRGFVQSQVVLFGGVNLAVGMRMHALCIKSNSLLSGLTNTKPP